MNTSTTCSYSFWSNSYLSTQCTMSNDAYSGEYMCNFMTIALQSGNGCIHYLRHNGLFRIQPRCPGKKSKSCGKLMVEKNWKQQTKMAMRWLVMCFIPLIYIWKWFLRVVMELMEKFEDKYRSLILSAWYFRGPTTAWILAEQWNLRCCQRNSVSLVFEIS